MKDAPDPVRVLHVDDEPGLADTTATFLGRVEELLSVETATSVTEALELLAESGFECIVSDYDMSDRNGIEFLETVRAQDPKLPFILYTGKGSEELASEAIAAGVTDYLQKRGGTDQYDLLANRIRNAVDRYRVERELERTRQRYERLVLEISDVIVILNAAGAFDYLSPSVVDVLGYRPEELLGESGFDLVHPDDRETALALFEGMIADPERRPTAEFRFSRRDDSWVWLEVRGRNLLDVSPIAGLVVYARDVSEHREYERRLRRQNERLEEFIGVVSHDLRNPISVLAGALDLAEETGDPEQFARCRRAVERVSVLIDDLLTLARQGEMVADLEPVDLANAVERCWQEVDAGCATLRADTNHPNPVLADGNRLEQLLTNLVLNAIQHGGSDVTVVVGDLADGFYIEDDGAGIPADDRDRVFDSGHTTSESGTGLGLGIVSTIAKAHGWEVSLTESETGGARFEVTGVERSAT